MSEETGIGRVVVVLVVAMLEVKVQNIHVQSKVEVLGVWIEGRR